ncbi:MAG: APC family permease [Clostridiales bacterium]|nr:APC family permease [Clostridiales bacterium]
MSSSGKQKKLMNLFDLTFMAMGGIIGAGIFSSVGSGIGVTGRSITLALIIGMLFQMSQQVRYVFTSSMFKVSGGMYSQDALVLNPYLTGVAGVMLFINALNWAVYGISIASYLGDLFPVLKNHQELTAAAALAVFFVIGYIGVTAFTKVLNVFGILKFFALGLFIFYGFSKVQSGGFAGEPYFYGGTADFFTAVALMSFACGGATKIMNVQALAANPKRDIPKAWLIAQLAVVVIYALLGYVAAGVAPYDMVANQSLGAIGGMFMPVAVTGFFVIGGALMSISTSLLSSIPGTPLTVMGMADDGWLPKIFKNRLFVFILLYIINLVPIFLGFSLSELISMLLVPSAIVTAIKNYRGMKLPEMYPEEWESSPIKCSIGLFKALMAISIVTSLITSAFSMRNLTAFQAAGTVVMTILVFVYPNLRMKTGAVKIVSTTDMDKEEAAAAK